MAKVKEKEKVKVTKKKSKAVEGGDLVVANAKKSVTEQLAFGIDMNAYLDSVIEVVEKKTKISSQNMMRYAERISTGILALDMYLDGGIVAGGWYTFAGGEQSCKSTLAMCIAAALIKQNFRGTTSYFDYEGSADEQYAANQLRTLGVKINPQEIFGVKDDETGEWLIRPRIRYYAPDNGEKFFDYMSGLRRRLPDKIVEKDGKAFFVFENSQENRKLVGNHYDKKWFSAHNQFKVPAPDAHMQSLTLVDSYPAMMPDQVDDDEGSKAMALQARMFSDGIKRFRGGMRRKMMTVIGINQLRQKPATMFGCLHGSTKVPFVDGRVHTMKEIVENRIEGEVWSYNETTKEIEPRKIKAWFNNGEVTEKSHWMKIVSRCPETGNGMAQVIVTPNHEILTDNGWKRADEVKLTDRVVSKYTSVRKGSIRFFLNALAVGDSSIVADSPNSGLMKLQDNQNPEYVQWKMDKLNPFMEFESYSASHGGECYITRGSDFVAYSKQVPNREVWNVAFDDMSFALYYMDDGNLKTDRKNAMFSAKRFSGDETALSCIQLKFAEHGFAVDYSIDDGCFRMSLDESDRFFQRIRKFIPECMQYKLPEEHRGFYEEFDLDSETHVRPVYQEVIRIEEGSDRAFREKTKYDINVEHNHNYMVGNSANGIIVHNSPEYEPCGDALKFYSDVRLRMASRAVPQGWPQLKDAPGIVGEDSVTHPGGIDRYRFIAIRTIKNKMGGIPNQTTWVRLWESDGKGEARGFDPVFDTWHYMKTIGLIAGTRNRIKFVDPCPLASKIAIDWQEFRTLINGNKEQITKICKKMDVKPNSLRAWCFKFLQSPKGRDMLRASIIAKGKSSSDESDDE